MQERKELTAPACNRARLQVNLRIEKLVCTHTELREHGDAIECVRNTAVSHCRREHGIPDAQPSGVGNVCIHGELHELPRSAVGFPKLARRARYLKGKPRGNAHGLPERPIGENVELKLHAKGGCGYFGSDVSRRRTFDSEACLSEVFLELCGFGYVCALQARVNKAVDSDGSA